MQWLATIFWVFTKPGFLGCASNVYSVCRGRGSRSAQKSKSGNLGVYVCYICIMYLINFFSVSKASGTCERLALPHLTMTRNRSSHLTENLYKYKQMRLISYNCGLKLMLKCRLKAWKTCLYVAKPATTGRQL